jgi:hypothetical protein
MFKHLTQSKKELIGIFVLGTIFTLRILQDTRGGIKKGHYISAARNRMSEKDVNECFVYAKFQSLYMLCERHI